MKDLNRRQLLLQGPVALSAAVLLPNAGASATDTSKETETHQVWVHPGVFQRQSDLQFMKEQILAGREPWKTAWDHMLALPESALDFTPQPVTHVIRGSYGAGQKGDKEINASIAAAESHTLQWVVTGHEAHARKAASILDAWSGTLADFSGNDAMLLGGWTGGKWANIGEILRATWKGWSVSSQRQFEGMLRTVYVPLLHDFFPEANGNWDAAIMHSLLAVAVFCEDRPLFDYVLEHYRFGPGTSGITRYIYPNGQCEESTRDQAHTQLGLGYFAITSLIAWNQNVDLFSEAANRLALGFEYTARYMLGEPVFAYGTISEQVRGRFDDWYELPLQHFRFDRGIAMPYTEQAAAKARLHSRSVLTMFRGGGPASPKYPAPIPSHIALEAGASLQTETTPATAIGSGQSIQDALNGAKAGDTVSLAAGLHTLDQPLNIPSGVTLAGVGRATVLFLDAKKLGPAILNTDPELHDVTIRNLLIEAGPLSQPTRDPNQDRRPLATQLVPGRGGIAFITDLGKSMRHLTLDRVSVRNATMSAVELFAAKDVTVRACDLSASGGAVAPGPGKHQCLKLSHVANATITASRLTDSFHGSGLAIAFSQGVKVQDCELARNATYGVQVAESTDINISGCRLEGNGKTAIGELVWMRPNKGVTEKDNEQSNNAVMLRPEV